MGSPQRQVAFLGIVILNIFEFLLISGGVLQEIIGYIELYKASGNLNDLSDKLEAMWQQLESVYKQIENTGADVRVVLSHLKAMFGIFINLADLG